MTPGVSSGTGGQWGRPVQSSSAGVRRGGSAWVFGADIRRVVLVRVFGAGVRCGYSIRELLARGLAILRDVGD